MPALAASAFLLICHTTGEPVQSQTLENGLKVLMLVKRSVPVVSVQVWYQTGSVQETDGIRGIAHLFEHMMFRGSENFGPEEHTRLIHDVGGTSNAFTAEHVTVYHQSVPSQHLELALRLEADRMGGLKLDQEVLNTERQVVIEEYHRYLNNPFARAFLEFRKKLYSRHPYQWTPLGDLDDLSKLTIEDCQGFYGSHYVPNNAALVIAGDIEPEQTMDLVRTHFAGIPKREAARVSYESEPPQEEKRHHRLKLAIEVPVVALAFRAPSADNEDVPAFHFLDQILASGRSSRLREQVVKKSRIAVEVGGHLLCNKDPGLYACFAAYLPNRRSRTVTEALLDEVVKLQKDGVTEEELESARNRLLSSKVFELYSADAIASEIGFAEFVEGDFHRYETMRERIEGVTAEDIRRVAQEYLVERRMTILQVKPDKFRLKYWLGGLVYSVMR